MKQVTLKLDATLALEADATFDYQNLDHIFKWFKVNCEGEIRSFLKDLDHDEEFIDWCIQEFGLGSQWLYEGPANFQLRFIESEILLTLTA